MNEYIEWLEGKIEFCQNDKDLQKEHWAFCQALKKYRELCNKNFSEVTDNFLSHLQQKDELSIKMGNDENFKHHMNWLKENRRK